MGGAACDNIYYLENNYDFLQNYANLDLQTVFYCIIPPDRIICCWIINTHILACCTLAYLHANSCALVVPGSMFACIIMLHV